MKFVSLAILVALCCGCSRDAGSGGTDFSSTDGDITYHDLTALNDPLLGPGAFSYTKIEMKADHTFTQEEYVSEDGATGEKCVIVGTWDLPTPDSSSTVGNELVVDVTTLNGNPVTVTKRYELTNISYESLKLRFPTETSDRDLTNKAYVDTYPELQSVNLSGFADDDFCDR